MLTRGDTIAATRAAFRWDIPARYNIGVDITDQPAARVPDKAAIIDVDEAGGTRVCSYAELRDRSNQFANVVSSMSAPGDRIGVLLPQCIETAIAHAGILKSGRISLPLFTLFGPDALLHRLADSEASIVVADREGARKLALIRDQLPALEHVICVDEDAVRSFNFNALCDDASKVFTAADTSSEDPAILIYTSGTTGKPKGALHAHRVLLGHLPGVEMSHDFFPQHGDRFWTPADWAWIGGLLDVLMPALHHGVTVVACRFRKFTSDAAFDLMRTHKVRNAFLPPTALKMMRMGTDHDTQPLDLRSVASGGETLGKELIDWGQRYLGTTINEFYGQTECNMIVSSCSALAPAEPGVMGFAVPGHIVELFAVPRPALAADGETGRIAVRAPDPVMLLKYWNNPEATAQKFLRYDGHDWLLTGDMGVKTSTGRIAFVGRNDDLISSSGYRIGPGEIEDCLLTHPAVQMAGVVGKPDPVRGEIVVAFVQLTEGRDPSDALADEIADHVKSRLAAYEFPRIVRFLRELPLTTTGKIIRAELRAIAREGR